MSDAQITSCHSANALEAAQIAYANKTLRMPKHGIVHGEVCLALMSMAGQHSGHRRTCQTIEATREGLGVAA